MTRQFSVGEAFEAMGLAGWLLALVTLGIVAVGIACAVIRVPRGPAAFLVVASLLIPLGAGVLGLWAGRHSVEQVLASLNAPTAQDAACGEREARTCIVFGLGASLVCYALSLVVLARSRERADGPGGPTGYLNPVRA